MNFSFYIARRYLFSKKSHNAINVISGISVCGVALATLALVCTLSVFNGFQSLVSDYFTAFDPELKITPVTGKVFDGQDPKIQALRSMPEIEVVSESLEDNAMVQYKGRQAMAVIKGVEDNFDRLTPIDSILFGRGDLLLHDEVADYAIPGIQLLSVLGSGIRFLDPLEIYAPKRGAKVNLANPATAFTGERLFSTGLTFAVNQEKTGMEFVEQAGSSYLFTDGSRNEVASSEVYWGRYTVWVLPTMEAAENADAEQYDAKPVIYLYPEKKTAVTVKLNYAGELTCTYPAYNDGWKVCASPDGTLTDADGQTYNYLYWEGVNSVVYDFSEGFCVAGSDTAAFLENTLNQLGLTRKEANEFIVYWLPLMKENPYNLIAFQSDSYTQAAQLSIEPAPDTLLRVFMAWKPLESAVDISTQNLTAPVRTGFTAVEWGGCQVK